MCETNYLLFVGGFEHLLSNRYRGGGTHAVDSGADLLLLFL